MSEHSNVGGTHIPNMTPLSALMCRILPRSIYNIKPFNAHYVPTSSNMSHTPSQHLQYLLWFTHIRHATNIFIVSLTFYIITHICLGLGKNTNLYLLWFILQNLQLSLLVISFCLTDGICSRHTHYIITSLQICESILIYCLWMAVSNWVGSIETMLH